MIHCFDHRYGLPYSLGSRMGSPTPSQSWPWPWGNWTSLITLSVALTALSTTTTSPCSFCSLWSCPSLSWTCWYVLIFCRKNLLDYNKRTMHTFVVFRSLADQTTLSLMCFVTDIDWCGRWRHWRRTEEGVSRQTVHPSNTYIIVL